MVERKIFIKKIQEILNNHYHKHVFGMASQEYSDEEVDFFINRFDELQREFDKFYEYYGYEFIGDYKTLIEIDMENKIPEGKGDK